MDEIDPQERIRELEAEVARYQAAEKKRRETGKKVVGSATELAARMHLGKEILPASTELFEAVNRNRRDKNLEIPTDESAELVAAVLRRLLRVRGLSGLRLWVCWLQLCRRIFSGRATGFFGTRWEDRPLILKSFVVPS